jgi:ABC-2 type transport system permease protein
MGATAIVAVFVVGNLRGADLPLWRLVLCGLIGWGCTLVFAAFGLFMGYLLPSENVMQLLGPSLALLALAGGLFTPLDNFSQGFQDFAKLTPAYGVGVLSRAPFGSDGNVGLAVLNIAVWTAIFVGGAAWRMSKDTKRV